MADFSQSQKQRTKQVQRQQQKLSHLQIQALNFLEMGSQDLREQIYKAASENPAIEIVKTKSAIDSDQFQRTLENTEDNSETLQSHLMHQLNAINLSEDEYELSQKLIYNLDKNGFYGSSLSPETLINRTRSLQNREMLEKCIERIQHMDPVGICCKNAEESLYIQACVADERDDIALFILNGHLEMLDPPEPSKIIIKLLKYKENWHKKTFAGEIILDKVTINNETVTNALKFILNLNPHPAQGYISDTTSNYEKPDVVLIVEKIPGRIISDDYSRGLVAGDDKFHFQVKYASGVLPEIRISPEFMFDKENVLKAQELINNLQFRESSIILQGCSIVHAQKQFFLHGPDFLSVLTRRQIALELGIHESTVSRMASKKSSKYIQTEFGLYPASYFFSSGVSSNQADNKLSSSVVKSEILKIIKEYSDKNLTDTQLTALLNEKGIKIARRTVAKYRNQAGIKNSYRRN